MTTRRLLVTALLGLRLLATTPTLRVEAAAKKPSVSEPVFTPQRLAGRYRWVKSTVKVTFAKGNTSGGDVPYGPDDTAGADLTVAYPCAAARRGTSCRRRTRAGTGSVEGVSETPVGSVVESMSPRSRLARKVRFTKAFAIVECVSYALLLIFMFRKYVLDDRGDANYLMLRVVAYFHGMICIAFGVMILDIFRAMKWSTRFALLTLAGPPGALIAHRRLRYQPMPTVVSKRDMLF